MRLDYRLVLIACVSACAPMLPSAPPAALPADPVPVAPAPGSSGAAPATAAVTDAADAAGFEGWKQGFLARKGGTRRDAYALQLADLTPDPEVIRLDRNQPEFSRPAGAYIANAVSGARIAEARRRLEAVPWSVTQRFGVPSEILVAIWGLESSFGQVQGSKDVIRSLATLAFDGRRRDWAEDQLKNALDIVIDGRRDRSGLLGSWAGAMGQTQFMPDNYLRLGIDQSGDGKVDIWGTESDALASAANLLAQAGWKRGQSWGHEVQLPAGFDYALAEADGRPWSFWSGRGVSLTRGAALSSDEAAENGVILLPQGARGPAFLALPNHYVIRRYNNSVSYALAIGLMADGVAGRPGLVGTWPDDGPISREQRFGAQTALARLGYDPGVIDGVIGSGTRRALRQWQMATGRLPDGYLTAAIADELMRGM